MRGLLVDDRGAARRDIGELVRRARRDTEVIACSLSMASLTLVRPFEVIAASALEESSAACFSLIRELRDRGDRTPFVAYDLPDTCDEARSTALHAGVTVTFGAPLVLPKSFCTQLEQLAQTIVPKGEQVITVGAITIETRSRTVSVNGQSIAVKSICYCAF